MSTEKQRPAELAAAQGSALTETEKELEYFKRYAKELEEECDHLRQLIPTTAQAMVYHSLLMKYQQLEKQLVPNDQDQAQPPTTRK